MKKIVVDKEKCICCGSCVGMDTEHFEFDDSGVSCVNSQENLDSADLMQCISGCPTGAISIEDTDDSNNKEKTNN